jgi:hypothetical protein
MTMEDQRVKGKIGGNNVMSTNSRVQGKVPKWIPLRSELENYHSCGDSQKCGIFGGKEFQLNYN